VSTAVRAWIESVVAVNQAVKDAVVVSKPKEASGNGRNRAGDDGRASAGVDVTAGTGSGSAGLTFGLGCLLLMVGVDASAAEGGADRTPAWEVGVGYLAQTFSHPGGVAWGARHIALNPSHSLLVRLSLGGYVHPRNHAGMLGVAEFGHQLAAAWGLFGEVTLGVGVLGSFLDAPAYSVASDGSLSKGAAPGRASFLGLASLGAGWDFSSAGLPLRLSIRQQVGMQTYDGPLVLRFFTIVGLAYAL
jgi:hypothetical protein